MRNLSASGGTSQSGPPSRGLVSNEGKTEKEHHRHSPAELVTSWIKLTPTSGHIAIMTPVAAERQSSVVGDGKPCPRTKMAIRQ